MKFNFIALLSAFLVSSANVYAESDKFKPSDGQQIVGGEQAEANAWPWMAALVYTYEEVVTSLHVDGQVYTSDSFDGSPSGNVSGLMMDCGLGDAECDATNQVCLIERGDITFAEKALACETGGGVGVIIYNNVEGLISGTLGLNFEGTIPIVAVTQAQGEDLKEKIGTLAEIEVSSSASLIQSSTCGGSFIGDRWVLTASHCVDGPNAQYLKVNVGEYNLNDGAENAIDVKNIYLHADYNDSSLINDIALIELDQSLTIQAVNLGDASTTNSAADINSMVTVMGWGGRLGYEAGGGPTSDFPNILHQVDLTLFDNQECGEMLADAQGVTGSVTPEEMGIASVMICAGTYDGGKGSCQGDSGGPLVVNSNEGYQQIGVVSWGIGCAAQGYPGVYARVAEFLPWIEGITEGIAMQQNLVLGYLPANKSVSAMITATNNSSQTTTLSFNVDASSVYEVDGSGCSNVAAGASCEAQVTFNTPITGDFDSYINVSSDNSGTVTTRTKVTASALNISVTLGTEFDSNSAITWYTGGDANWTDNPTDDGVQSGVIDNLSRSVLMAEIEGEGELTFEWSVSSEENTDDPESPYDALYVYINGGQYEFISGEVDFTSVTIELGEGVNHVTWIYEKDPFTKEFEDTGYLKNVQFEAKSVSNPTNPVNPGSTNENKRSSGGLGFGGMLLILMPLLIVIRRKK